MKKLILSVVAVAIVSASCFSQEKQEGKKRPQATPEQRAERQMGRYNEEFGLTEEQKPKIKAIVMEREKQRDAIREKYPEKNDEAMQANKKINADAEKQIKALLTPEQLEKQKQVREEKRKKNEERRAKNPPPPPAPPADKKGTPPPPPPAPAPAPKDGK